MNSLRYASLALCVALTIPLSGCKVVNASDNWPRVLHYAYSPQADQLQTAMSGSQSKLMAQYLQSQLHIPVDLVQVQGYAPSIEAMRAEKIDKWGSSLNTVDSRYCGSRV